LLCRERWLVRRTPRLASQPSEDVGNTAVIGVRAVSPRDRERPGDTSEARMPDRPAHDRERISREIVGHRYSRTFQAGPFGDGDHCASTVRSAYGRAAVFGRFIESVRNRRLALARPHLWDDPFENFLYQAHLESADGNPVSITGLRMRLYGQCWSLLPESDAMWRIYSPEKAV